jgi:hypothetical protein
MDTRRDRISAPAHRDHDNVRFSFPVRSGARSITSFSALLPLRVSVTQNLFVLCLAEQFHIAGDIQQAGKIQFMVNHDTTPCLQRISSRVAFASGIGGPTTSSVLPFEWTS